MKRHRPHDASLSLLELLAAVVIAGPGGVIYPRQSASLEAENPVFSVAPQINLSAVRRCVFRGLPP